MEPPASQDLVNAGAVDCSSTAIGPCLQPCTQWMLRYSVRKAATTMRTFCCIHPVCQSCRMPANEQVVRKRAALLSARSAAGFTPASTIGKPVCPFCQARRAAGSSLHFCMPDPDSAMLCANEAGSKSTKQAPGLRSGCGWGRSTWWASGAAASRTGRARSAASRRSWTPACRQPAQSVRMQVKREVRSSVQAGAQADRVNDKALSSRAAMHTAEGVAV